jgi:hypothetical protein
MGVILAIAVIVLFVLVIWIQADHERKFIALSGEIFQLRLELTRRERFARAAQAVLNRRTNA